LTVSVWFCISTFFFFFQSWCLCKISCGFRSLCKPWSVCTQMWF